MQHRGKEMLAWTDVTSRPGSGHVADATDVTGVAGCSIDTQGDARVDGCD